jgi:hypothetical protein
MTDHSFYLVDPGGIEGIPLGRYYSEVAPRLYVPVGMTLVPSVDASVLSELVQGEEAGAVFFGDDGTPELIPSTAFGPVSRRAIGQLLPALRAANPLSEPESTLPLLTYESTSRFPIWGVPNPKPDRPESE